MQLVCLIVKLLKGLSVEHTHKEVQAVVVAVRDNAEDSLLALAQLAKLQIVRIGYLLYFPESE